MLIKFLPTKNKGDIEGLVDYLVRERNSKGLIRNPPPKILGGNPQQLILLVKDLALKTKYQTGAVSFAPTDRVSEKQQREVMELFERTAFAGLRRDQYDILWVQHSHTQDNRLELHFVIPCIELSTGKSLNATWPGSHDTYYKALRDYLNNKCDWASPDDPARKRDIQPGFYAYIHRENEQLQAAGLELDNRIDHRKLIHEFLVEKMEQGVIRDRETMIQTLSAQGYQFRKIENNFITITREDLPRPIRFKGRMYEKSWQYRREVNKGLKLKQKKEDREQLIARLKQDLERRIEKRALYFSQRYLTKDKEQDTEIYHRLNNPDIMNSEEVVRWKSSYINPLKLPITDILGESDDGNRETDVDSFNQIQRGLSTGQRTIGSIGTILNDGFESIGTSFGRGIDISIIL